MVKYFDSASREEGGEDMSTKTLKKWFIVISILICITLSAKLFLDFAITMEEMKNYAIVFRFWRGIRDGCAFCTFLLAGVWLFIILYSLFIAIAEPLREGKNNSPRREENYNYYEDDRDDSWDDLYGDQTDSWDDLYS
jgi:hypothetical protein